MVGGEQAWARRGEAGHSWFYLQKSQTHREMHLHYGCSLPDGMSLLISPRSAPVLLREWQPLLVLALHAMVHDPTPLSRFLAVGHFSLRYLLLGLRGVGAWQLRRVGATDHRHSQQEHIPQQLLNTIVSTNTIDR